MTRWELRRTGLGIVFATMMLTMPNLALFPRPRKEHLTLRACAEHRLGRKGDIRRISAPASRVQADANILTYRRPLSV
jgi:hypothetical protein